MSWICTGGVHTPGPDRGRYPTAYAATYAECEAATDAAYASVDAAGVVWDDGRRRWVQRPRAVS